MKRRFLHSLLAVVVGNAIYFSLLPRLPARAQHRPFIIDWGLAVDFWFCLVCYGLLALLKWFRPPRSKNK
jgi:hypothetical protein